MDDFVEAEGFIHLVGTTAGGEFTLCGDAFDLSSDIEGYQWKPSKKRIVTCPECARIILHCRGVKVKVETE
jgi:hypothetical protein